MHSSRMRTAAAVAVWGVSTRHPPPGAGIPLGPGTPMGPGTPPGTRHPPEQTPQEQNDKQV